MPIFEAVGQFSRSAQERHLLVAIRAVHRRRRVDVGELLVVRASGKDCLHFGESFGVRGGEREQLFEITGRAVDIAEHVGQKGRGVHQDLALHTGREELELLVLDESLVGER